MFRRHLKQGGAPVTPCVGFDADAIRVRLVAEVADMEKAEVDRWLRSYVEAWKSYDRDLIGELFAEDVEYRYHPYDEPVVGRAAVVFTELLGYSSGEAAESLGVKPATVRKLAQLGRDALRRTLGDVDG